MMLYEGLLTIRRCEVASSCYQEQDFVHKEQV